MLICWIVRPETIVELSLMGFGIRVLGIIHIAALPLHLYTGLQIRVRLTGCAHADVMHSQSERGRGKEM